MNDSKISVRYSKALFQTALEEKLTEEVMKDIKLLEVNLKAVGFKEFLESPVIKVSEKKKLVSSVFKSAINPLTFNFLTLVLENKREAFLDGIIRNFSKYWREEKKIKKAEIIVASDINETTRKQFVSILEKTFDSGIELEETIRPSIIGGFVLKVEDEQYDASIVNSLTRMKKLLLQSSIEK